MASKAVAKKDTEFKEVTKKDTVRVLIHKTMGDQGQQFVPVGVNGKQWLIRRGEEVDVPPSVAEALKCAVRYEVGYDQRDHSTPIREMQAYPFSIVG
jgi:hypothetical protein